VLGFSHVDVRKERVVLESSVVFPVHDSDVVMTVLVAGEAEAARIAPGKSERRSSIHGFLTSTSLEARVADGAFGKLRRGRQTLGLGWSQRCDEEALTEKGKRSRNDIADVGLGRPWGATTPVITVRRCG